MASIFEKVKNEAQKNKIIQRNIYIPENMWNHLQKIVLKEKLNNNKTISASQIIVDLIDNYLENR